MTDRAFYNEIDPVAAHVIRAMIADGHIAPGDVCERSIKDLTAHDLRGYTQCHFFAGGGFWSLSARLAGWRDEKPIWTASCPCQPFSQAGKGAGIDDPRHLWPDVDRLVREALADGQHVPVIVGEQVGGSAGYDWFNGVRTDLESQGYETFVADTPACAVDAPHIRQRLFWIAVADAECARQQGSVQQSESVRHARRRRAADQPERRDELDLKMVNAAGQRRREGKPEPEFWGGRSTVAGTDAPSELGHSFQSRLEGQSRHDDGTTGRAQPDRPVATADGSDMGHADGTRQFQRGEWREGLQPERGRRDMHTDGGDSEGIVDNTIIDGQRQSPWEIRTRRDTAHLSNAAQPDGSFWSDHEWIICRDGKARRTKSRVRNVVDGLPGRRGEDGSESSGIISEATDYSLLVPSFKGRVNAWKITGNAIVPVQAAQMLGALLDSLNHSAEVM